MLKKWIKRIQWKTSLWWYRVKLHFGWWYCERCKKMHSPFQSKYEFSEEGDYECSQGVYDIPVPPAYEGDPDYFYSLAKDLHRVG